MIDMKYSNNHDGVEKV